ncbi:MAG: RHS repeat-associated core domain-containing protein, partial [Candidatus Komeilibacteria bacterium]|nr:RHS repeat-associated core domain-containing protein [Candidatus Komeilibacteria bacterium]
VTNPLGVTRTSYDQWQQTITDPNNKHKDFVFDAFGRLTQVREYLGDAAYPTNYQYDANNNLTKIINAKNEIKSFAYDLAGRKIQEEDFHLSVDPTFSVWQYSYDQNNNLTSTIRPDGEQVRFAYDELDRQLTENWVHQVNRADPIETAYVYDLGVNSIGRLSSVRFLAGSKSFNHDRLGRVIQQRLTIGAGQGAQNFDLAFTYDIAGNNLTTTYPNGVVARNIYNNGGLLESVLAQEPGQAEQIIISGTKYLPNGSVGTRDFANGISTFNQYDINQMNRLIHKTTRRANDGVNLQDLNYTYDPVGNITRIIDASATNAAKTANYQYDDLDRLTRAEITNAANNQNYTQSFSYDITGNIITFGPQNGPYEYAGGNTALAAATFASPQAVTKIGGNQNFTYDRNGNLTGQTAPNGNWIHAWDWKDRLTSSRHLIIGLAEGNREDQSVAYSYDEQKQRIVKHDVTGNKTTAYVEKYFDQEGNTQKAYIFAGGSKVASLEITPNGQNQPQTHLIFHHEDHLTGANVDTNADGQVIQLLDYFPYGDSRIDESAQGYHNDYEFTGKERDQETDLLYYEARYYNSAIGRFISRDTWQGDIKDPQSLNKYSYVRNNPLRLVDPDGQAFVDYVNAAGGYAVGFSQGVGAFAVGTANSMAHPVQTFNQIGNAGSAAGQWTNGFVRSYQTDPQGTLNSIAGSLNSAISSFESKSAYEQGKAIGNIFGQIDAGVAASGLTGQALKTSSVLDRPMYRGGSDMTARPGIDVKVDVNGMVDSNRGITVYDDPTHPNVIKFGGPYEIRRLPNGLEVIQRGQDLTHHEIVSTRPTLFNRYQSLLNDIKTKAIR